MVKIGENEDFHPRRKMTLSLEMVAFLEKIFLTETAYIKARKVRKISGS